MESNLQNAILKADDFLETAKDNLNLITYLLRLTDAIILIFGLQEDCFLRKISL